MTKQQRIDEQHEEIMALRREIRDLKRRHDYMCTELAELAQGIGVKPSWYSGAWDSAMKYKAGLAVAKVMGMPLREAP